VSPEYGLGHFELDTESKNWAPKEWVEEKNRLITAIFPVNLAKKLSNGNKRNEDSLKYR
jgi:hypothetical protein